MKSKRQCYAKTFKVLILIMGLTIFGDIHAQFSTLPHHTSGVLTEVTLNNGETLRGKVIRVVPGSYIEIRFPNKQNSIIKMSDIKHSKSVLSNITENSFSVSIGANALSSFPPTSSDLMVLGLVGISFDFGKNLKYSFMIDHTQGGLVTEEPFFNNEYMATSFAFAFGYKHNRNKKIGQSYFIGLRRFSVNDDNVSNVGYLTHRFELPITFRDNQQIIPFIEYNHLPSVDVENSVKHVIMAGFVYRFYMGSTYF